MEISIDCFRIYNAVFSRFRVRTFLRIRKCLRVRKNERNYSFGSLRSNDILR